MIVLLPDRQHITMLYNDKENTASSLSTKNSDFYITLKKLILYRNFQTKKA